MKSFLKYIPKGNFKSLIPSYAVGELLCIAFSTIRPEQEAMSIHISDCTIHFFKEHLPLGTIQATWYRFVTSVRIN